MISDKKVCINKNNGREINQTLLIPIYNCVAANCQPNSRAVEQSKNSGARFNMVGINNMPIWLRYVKSGARGDQLSL